MKARIVRMSDVAKHGGRLDPSYYIENEIGEEIPNTQQQEHRQKLIQLDNKSINEPDERRQNDG
jgi:hypothetical protein